MTFLGRHQKRSSVEILPKKRKCQSGKSFNGWDDSLGTLRVNEKNLKKSNASPKLIVSHCSAMFLRSS